MTMLKKKVVMLILALAVLGSAGTACRAEIIPPYGEGQIGLQAVVLCESLTVRKERSASSKAVKKLQYGDRIIVQERWDGWAECFLSDAVDAGPAGWVNSDYIAIDPAWY
ncbi:MAG: SH3 domain-containing protein, partial [Clostridia bacterium]|nr:SH3 domain-containing protein [Clostridia bacterium]